MLKIDNSLLQEVGLGALPDAEKNSFLKHIYETLEMRVGIRLADQMSNEQLDEFERYFEAKDDAGAFKWLETNFPNYKDIVQQEFDKLKAEVAQSAPQILAASQAQAAQAAVQPPGAAQVPAGSPAPDPSGATQAAYADPAASQAAAPPSNLPTSQPAPPAQPSADPPAPAPQQPAAPPPQWSEPPSEQPPAGPPA